MRKIQKTVKLIFTFIGALVGAGFASGQELVKFFVSFKDKGIEGAILSGILIATIGGVVIYEVNRYDVKNYKEFLENIFSAKIAKLMDIFIMISIWISLGIMLIGSASLLNTQINLPKNIGFLLAAFLIGIALWKGNKGLLNINTILVPILLVLSLVSSITYLNHPITCLQMGGEVNLPNWWSSGILYATFNMLLGIVVITSLKDNEKIPIKVGLIGGLILSLMMLIMVKSLLVLPLHLRILEMPMLVLSKCVNDNMGSLYSLGLLIALFTTALADTHSLCKRLNQDSLIKYRKNMILILLSTLIFIPWSFSFLVGTLYPLLGYISLPLVLGVIINALKAFKIR